MYAILGFLDEQTEKKITDIRDDLQKASITDYSMKPHVTIATHEELDVENHIKMMDEYFEKESRVPLFFPSLGMFLNSGTLFYAPTKTLALTNFHNRYHEHFKTLVNPESLYAPNQWVPHCTIASYLSHEKLVKAFDWCANRTVPFEGEITSVTLIELHFEEGICTDTKELHHITLKNET